MKKLILLLFTTHVLSMLHAKEPNMPDSKAARTHETVQRFRRALYPQINHNPTTLGRFEQTDIKNINFLELAELLTTVYILDGDEKIRLIDVFCANFLDERFAPLLLTKNPQLAFNEIGRCLNNYTGQFKGTTSKTKYEVLVALLKIVFAHVQPTLVSEDDKIELLHKLIQSMTPALKTSKQYTFIRNATRFTHSPCGNYVVTATQQHAINLWTVNGELIRSWQLDKKNVGRIKAIAFYERNSGFAVVAEKTTLDFPFIDRLIVSSLDYFKAIKDVCWATT